MGKLILRRALFPVALIVGFVLLHLLLDRLLPAQGGSDWGHVIAAAAVLLLSYILLQRALDTSRRTENALRLAQDELEQRVHERTLALQGANAALQTEIAERHRFEQALGDSEEKYRVLFQNMAEGFALYELLYDDQGAPADWRILEVNSAYTRHTGVSPDAIVGRRISELFPASLPE